MLDNKAKNILDLNDIKGVMVETMLERYTEEEVSESTLAKFQKFMNLQQKNNTSRNSIDSRIESLYKTIQKQYNDFVKLNEIITELD